MIDTFRSLHSGSILVLPNAWDAASARLVEQAGAPAIATTSAGVAWSLGVPDGDHLAREQAIALVARVVAAVAVPVTADIESGFGATPGEVGDTVRAVADAGAAGVNIEDALHDQPGLRPVEDQVARMAAARAAAPLFINARIDTYLLGIGPEETRMAETLARARAYLDAGADGIFVPGVVDRDLIAELVAKIDAPLNVLAMPGAPAVPELAELGVARASVGARVALAAYDTAVRCARELFSSGTYESLAASLTHGDLNAALAGNRA
ncbi:isocitrate lyase/PEP mutase family protein [Actinophytocola xanthii]|uniref:3-methyl-2-oxobutanoate hydroxymethyltransferase n=1 Tax=Actinophytocola xanthii TaxID=1912961 RepID=A0A1Q8BUN0_9PSEU|nr:isocitrate lyase/phosphoenolpyruvate mutase family protein [Actinophytocola xanthii]OLF05804.1 3-methyl-2-oxobutanoate hydroxymethyltransferase [Actinophytocola xanthii]